MKKGTIYKNLWASYESYFVYLGSARSGRAEAAKVRGIFIGKIADNKWNIERNAQFYKNSIEKDPEHFPVVGWIDIDKLLIDGILQNVNKPL